MKMNIALWDSALRMVFGALLVTWAVAGGPWWGYFGLVFIAMASWRYCPIYATLSQKSSKDS